MTRDEILAMEPGRELDTKIEIEVFGLKPSKTTPGWVVEGVRARPPRPFSTDIAAAWEVVEKMSEQWPQYQLAKIEDGWSVMWGFDGYGWQEATGKTAPEAICKAALLAVMDIE